MPAKRRFHNDELTEEPSRTLRDTQPTKDIYVKADTHAGEDIVQETVAWRYISLATRQYTMHTGWLSLVAMKFTDDSPTVKERWILPTDEIKPTIEWAKKLNEAQYNIYMSWALFKSRERTKATMVWSSAFVADWDDQTPKRLSGFSPTLTVVTSPGRKQEVFLHQPLSLSEADPTYKALAHRLGCDVGPSGDPVHLWRVPGTINWAKKSKNRKPAMATWDLKTNGKHTLEVVENDEEPDGSVWPESRKGGKLPKWVEAGIKEKLKPGDRSERFYKLVKEMGKAGWGIREITDKFRGTAFEEKYNGRMFEEIDRVLAKSDIEIPAEVVSSAFEVIAFSPTDKERQIQFLWYPYFPRGEVTLLDGDGGVGKTSMMLKVAYDLIHGGQMPNGEILRPGHKVLYVSLESDYAGFTLPVMKRLGLRSGDSFYHLENYDMTLDDQGLVRLANTVRQYKIDLVILDSLVDYLPDDLEMNDYKQSSHLTLKLRSVVALPTNCVIVAMRHNAKGTKEKLSQKGMGSMGWQKGSRSQLVVRDDNEVPDQFVVSHTKHQYSSEGPPLVYQFNEVDKRGVVEWVGLSEASPEELNDSKPDKDRRTKLKDAIEWLKEQLTDRDEVSAAWLFEQAEGRGFQKRLIQRAAASLKVTKNIDHKGGAGVTSMWSM